MADKEERKDGRSDEIDFSDPEEVEAWLGQVDAYLDDPDRQALAEEISRQFRRAPAGAPTSGIESELEKTQKRLSWVLEQIETQESADVRLHLGQLREQIIDDIEGLKQRINEVQLDGPDP
jgi:hypothetical protein